MTAEPSETSALVGEDLVVTYPEAADPVIDGESISIPAGQVTALVGPNGSGKSTLLETLSNQLASEAGVVRLSGREIGKFDGKELARKLGLLSQENRSPSGLTVRDLVTHGRYPHRGVFDRLNEADHEAIDHALSLAGVSDLADRGLGSLSGGQKQLAWIAMSLAQETDVLLLDEPTTFLDLHHQLEVMEVVETLNRERETTVVLVLHDINQAARYADHMVALADGAIHTRGSPEDVVCEELLTEVFGVSATIERDSGRPRVIPHRAFHPGDERSNNEREPSGARPMLGD
jgi:iron complex transport system ATP-binding protein